MEKRGRVYPKGHESPVSASTLLGESVRRGESQGNVSDEVTPLCVSYIETRCSPPVRPLFFEFDDARLLAVEEQFMVGPSLLVTPVVHEGKTAVTGYFPSEGGVTWRDWYSGEVS